MSKKEKDKKDKLDQVETSKLNTGKETLQLNNKKSSPIKKSHSSKEVSLLSSSQSVKNLKSANLIKLRAFDSPHLLEVEEEDAKLIPALKLLIEAKDRATTITIPHNIKLETFQKILDYCKLHKEELKKESSDLSVASKLLSTKSIQSALSVRSETSIEPTGPQPNIASTSEQSLSLQQSQFGQSSTSIAASTSIAPSTLDLSDKSPEISTIDQEYMKDVKDRKNKLFDLVTASEHLQVEALFCLACKYVADLIKGKPIEKVREIFNITCDLSEIELAEIDKENDFYEKDSNY